MNVPVHVGAARRALASCLARSQAEAFQGRQEADWILTHLLGCSRAALLACPERELSYEQRALAEDILRRRVSGEPLPFILGEADFWGRPFIVREGVLIPRPETELLVELALELLPEGGSSFLDWGTGSGCIAVTLLLERDRARAWMAEKSARSLRVARENLERHGVRGRGFLWHSAAPEDIPVKKGELDLVVSNPPYIPSAAIAGLMPEVRDHEPHLALDGGEDGMDAYRALFRSAPLWLRPGGSLLLEIGDERQAAVMRATSWPGFVPLREVPDYAGITRCMAWTWSAP